PEKVAVVTERGAENAREPEVRVNQCDRGRRARTEAVRLRVRIGVERRRGTPRRIARENRLFDTGVAIGIGDPDERRAPLKDADAAAELLLAAGERIPVEADTRFPTDRFARFVCGRVADRRLYGGVE